MNNRLLIVEGRSGRVCLFDHVTKQVADQKMALLNASGDARRGFEAEFREFGALGLFFASEGDGDTTALVSSFECGEDVRARATRRDAERDIARLGEGFDLSREDGFEAEVVAVRGQNGGVGREGESGEGRSIDAITHDKLGGEMLRVRGAATIAEEDDLLAVLERGEPCLGQRSDLITHRAEL